MHGLVLSKIARISCFKFSELKPSPVSHSGQSKSTKRSERWHRCDENEFRVGEGVHRPDVSGR